MQLSSDKSQVSENIFTSDEDDTQQESIIKSPSRKTPSVKDKTPAQPIPVYQEPIYRDFDYNTLPKVSDIDIPFFNRLSDLLSVVFPQIINDKFNILVEIESLKSQVITYKDFINGLSSESFVVQSQCLTWNTNFLVGFSRKFINGAMNEYLSNGSSLLSTMTKPANTDKPLSRMAEQFAKSVCECCFASINQILAPHLALNILTRYVEQNIDKAVLVDGREKVIMCKLMARVGEQAPRPITLVLPLTSLSPYLDELDNLANLLTGQLDEDDSRKRLSKALAHVPFELIASTPKEYVDLQRISQMQVGDIVPLPHFNQLEMKIIDEVIFKATLGSDGAFHAGLITQKMHHEDQD